MSGHEGSSPVTAVLSLTVFLAFLLLATQTLVHLYATTAITAAAFDVARGAAAEGRGCVAAGPHGTQRAEDHLRRRLGRFGDSVEVVCTDDGESTALTVRAPTPARVIGGPMRLGDIERTVRVRTEVVR
ncbi:MAG: hypothetical protein WDZ26_03900 [Nitriliruptoraceae bacterium]